MVLGYQDPPVGGLIFSRFVGKEEGLEERGGEGVGGAGSSFTPFLPYVLMLVNGGGQKCWQLEVVICGAVS